MWLDPEGTVTDNEGPHCRNCHTGASSCAQCHAGSSSTGYNFGTQLLAEGKSTAAGDAFLHTNAVANINGQCIDGGFSFPHRTLGANLLKDELYGVNFDGTAVAVGGTRTLTVTLNAAWEANYSLPWARSMTTETTFSAPGSIADNPAINESGEQLTGVGNVENLDSVCLDCHGGADSWKGDDKAAYYSSGKGWELLFKGLP